MTPINAAALFHTIKKHTGPVEVMALAGACFDPIRVRVVKSDLLATLEAQICPTNESPFSIYLIDNGEGQTQTLNLDAAR